MIYLVSDAIDAKRVEDAMSVPVTQMTVKDSIDLIRSWPVVQFDTETSGLDAHVCNLTSLQMGYKDFATGQHNEIVVDVKTVPPERYKYVLEQSMLVGHNLKFDLQFLYNHRIIPLHVYDTMVCEQMLYLGYSNKDVAYGLASVLMRYTGHELDKRYQKVIAMKGLTPQGIVYAANDVVWLQDIRKGQMLTAQSRQCTNALILENRFVPAIAYLEWCGVHLDEDKWKAKMKDDKALLDKALADLNNYVTSHTKLEKFVSSATQLDMFSSTSTMQDLTIDWNSPQQVVPLLQTIGFDTKVVDKKTKKQRDSADLKNLQIQKGVDDEFLAMYGSYSAAEKVVSTYGQNFLNLINPNTNRLHTEFLQIGTVTGRMSSGGKEDARGKGKMNKDLAMIKHLPADKVRFVNMQNLPARGKAGKVTRACFTAMPGNVFLSCDYSAEESRVQADVWNEKRLLDAFADGIDTHNLYAKMCYPDELKGVDVRDVKDKRPDLRQNAKFFEFELSYGGNGTETAKKLGLNKEKAMQNVANVLKEMPGMVAFKKKTGKFLKEHGYIVLHPKTGHRVYWPQWASWKAEEDRMDRQFWNDYNAYHKGTGDEVNRRVRKHMSESGDWLNKNVLNYPIQGGSAIVMKQAATDLFEWIVKKGHFGKILFCVFVHDELDCECPEELAPMFSEKMKTVMEKAARKYYKRLPIPADCSAGDHWIH